MQKLGPHKKRPEPKPRPTSAVVYDLVAHLHRQREFSLNTFGPGYSTSRILDHVRHELTEIEAAPKDLEEWIDLMMLAADGAWRAGYSPEQIAAMLDIKLTKNEQRDWPDWREADPNKAIEHIK
ncbi:MAG: dATP/dGTP pyrophosphohydrolase domain-containing protein [Pseudomonadota bacterium]|nr:dATP/dGTP pyrophosphohydrolase domain-containing protein [Pseudomonadota bacterium]